MANSAGTMPNTGRWGWYKDHEGREWRRVSTLIKKVETDSFYLDEWKKRQVLIGAARRDDIVMGVKALGPTPATGWTQQQKRQFNEWAEQCMTAAGSDEGKILGTAVHDLTERVDRGEPIDDVCHGLPGMAAAGLRSYAKLRELNGWRSVEIERTVVCDELEVAGSFDRIDIVPELAVLLGPGTCQHGHGVGGHNHPDGRAELAVIVDVKTEGDPLKNGLHIAPQLAIYSRAKRMWIPEVADLARATYVEAPCVRQDVAVIVHVRDGKAVPYFVDLTAGWEAAQAAARQLQREKAAKKWFAPVPGIVEPKPAEVLTDVAVAAQYASPYREPTVRDIEQNTSLAMAMLDASKMTATALGPAPMPNHQVGDTVTVGEIEFTKHSEWPAAPGEQVAERGADGLVRWSAMPPETKGEESTALRDALSAIAQASNLAALAETYRIWTEELGLAWVGEVAVAGEARRRIIECPQAALHTSGKCSCGWVDS